MESNKLFMRNDSRFLGVPPLDFKWRSYACLVCSGAASMYVVEVGLVPAQLTAYDAVWLDAS